VIQPTLYEMYETIAFNARYAHSNPAKEVKETLDRYGYKLVKDTTKED